MTAALLVVGAPAALAAPGNDDYANATNLGSASAIGVGGSNVDATLQTGEWVYNSGQQTVWYLWTSPITASVNVNLCTSDFDTVLAYYTNPGGAIPTSPDGSNDDTGGACGQAYGGGYGSTVTIDASTGVTYALQIQGYSNGETGSFCLSINGGSCGSGEEADNTPPPAYEAFVKGAAACDAANGWSQSWQQWVRDGLGGAVCERTIIYSNALARWVVARFDPAAGVYVPIDGASVGGSTQTPTVKAKLRG